MHPQLEATVALDTWIQGKIFDRLHPLLDNLSTQCRLAYRARRSAVDVFRVYTEMSPDIVGTQQSIADDILPAAIVVSDRSFVKELLLAYGKDITKQLNLAAAARDDAESLVELPEEFAEMRLGGGLSEDAVIAYMQHRDEQGWQLSERIWRNDAESRAGLNNALESHLRRGRGVFNDVATLAEFQVADPEIPAFLDDLQRAARAALAGDPAARTEFLRLLRAARATATELTPGRTGTRAFTLDTLRQLERVVQRGIDNGVDGIIDSYVNRRAKYRSSVLLRTEGVRASQFTTLEKYKSQSFVLAVQWNLSNRHRVVDECDFKAEADIGLGPGIYYKEYIPWPDHPSGICFLTSVLPRPEDVFTSQPFEPSDPARYREIVDQIRLGDLPRRINTLGRRVSPPLDEINALITGIPKVPPLPRE